jgi:ATP-binding cassette subfamily F protein 3
MLDNANCLILDEPTNHLDIDSAEALEAALDAYDGTIVVISHDRYFLDRVADRTVEVRDGELHSFEGGYSEWREAQEAQARVAAEELARAQAQERERQRQAEFARKHPTSNGVHPVKPGTAKAKSTPTTSGKSGKHPRG